jgi:hypothetical protein
MKKALPITLLLTAVALTALIYVKKTAASKDRSAIALLQQELRQKQSESEAEQERTLALERNLTAARMEAAEKEAKAAAEAKALATKSLPSTNQTTAGPTNLLKDPAMRQMMQKQQMQAVERNIKQLVNADMQKKLNLTPAEAGRLRELLLSKERPAIELLTALMSGELDQDQATALGLRVKEQRLAADAEVRTLLGTERHDYFDWHERSDPERGRVRSFRSQLADGGQTLTSEQQEQLVAAMYDERQRFKLTIDYDDPSAFDFTNLQDYFSEENMNRFFTEREQLNERTIARVQSILTSDQLPEFQRLLQEHLERGKTTVRMTQALFPMQKFGKAP